MTSINIEVIDYVVFLVLVNVAPWNGYRRFYTLANAVSAGDPSARMRFYRTILIEKWALAGVIAATWIALSRSAESIGLVAEFTEFAPLPFAGFALAGLAIGGLLLYARTVADSKQLRIRNRRATAPMRTMVPQTATERRWFGCVLVSASISEEVIYRGFLFAYLAAFIPGIGTGGVVILAGLIFGLRHAFEGLTGMVKAGTLGILFGVLYWMTGSLLAPMLVHVALDLTSDWIGRQVVSDADLEDVAAPAAL